MSKYYKAEDVISFLNTHCPKDMWEYQIADLPTIDIVHCRDCKYWKSEQICIGRWGWYGTMMTEADAFCSYGERTDE